MTQVINYLWNQSWQIAFLTIIVAAVTLLLKNKSAHIRYLLWLVILAKCLFPPLLTIPLAILPQKPPEPAAPIAFLESDTPVITVQAIETLPQKTLPASPTAPAEAGLLKIISNITIYQWLTLAWIAGLTLFTAATLIKAARINHYLHRNRKSPPSELLSTAENLSDDLKIKKLPKLWLLDNIGQPFVWGLLQPSIYLPAGFLEIGNNQHRKGILGHEISHILRFDHLINLLQIIAQAILWFNPFVWWANIKIRAEREKCCDEMAIAKLGTKPKEYSAAIVNTLITEHKAAFPLPSLAVTGPVKNIEDRIKTIMKPNKKFYKKPGIIVTISVLLLALIAIPTTLALTTRIENQPADNPEQTARVTNTYPTEAKADSAKVGPVIEFESNFYDFGKVSLKSVNSYDFKFTNTGDEALRIIVVNSDGCNCSASVSPLTICKPGESGKVTVRFNAGSVKGLQSKDIYVKSNDKNKPKIKLTFKADVVKMFEFLPQTLELSLKKPNGGCPDIILESCDRKPFAINSLQTSFGCIMADCDSNKVSFKFVLKPVVDLAKLKKYPKGKIQINLTHPSCDQLVMDYNAPPIFKTNPRTLIIFKAEPLKPIIRDKILLVNCYDEDFEIESTSSRQGYIKVLTTEKIAAAKYLFSLQITPPLLPNKQNYFKDQLMIKIKEGPELELVCRGFYAKSSSPKPVADQSATKNSANNSTEPDAATPIIKIETRIISIPADNNDINEFLDEMAGADKQSLDTNSLVLNNQQHEQLIKLIQSSPEAKILAAPKVTVIDSQTATVTTGRVVPIVLDVNENDLGQNGQPNPITDYINVGTKFNVIPKLLENENIFLDFTLENSEISGSEIVTFREIYSYENPIIQTVSVSSQTTLASGQTTLIKSKDAANKKILILITAEKAGLSPVRSIPAGMMGGMGGGGYGGTMGRGMGGSGYGGTMGGGMGGGGYGGYIKGLDANSNQSADLEVIN